MASDQCLLRIQVCVNRQLCVISIFQKTLQAKTLNNNYQFTAILFYTL